MSRACQVQRRCRLADSGRSNICHTRSRCRRGNPGGARRRHPADIRLGKCGGAFDSWRNEAPALTPTLNISRTLAWLDSEDHTKDEYLKYIGPGLRATYSWRIERQAGSTPEAIARRHANYEFSSSKLPLIQQSGVLILAGTDAGFLNSYDYPGIGLHDELGQLVKAGLTPLQALQASTINGARWLGKESRYGTLARGSASDLVILDGNPIADIGATRHIHGVVVRGQYLDRAKLDSMLDGVARDVSRLQAKSR